MLQRNSYVLAAILALASSPFSLLPSPSALHAQQPDLFSSELPTPIASREISLRFEKLGLEQGLSQATIYDMIQDRHGFMWFTTQAGLNRWDGYEMKVYMHNLHVICTVSYNQKINVQKRLSLKY